MANLPEEFLTRMKAQLGEDDFAAYLRAMDERPRRALQHAENHAGNICRHGGFSAFPNRTVAGELLF